MNSVIYDLQFGFTQKYSISHFLIRNWQNKRATKHLKFCLWNVFWPPKSFWHSRSWLFFIQKLNCNGIRGGVANNWFSSYLQNQLHYVSVNGFSSNLEHIHCSIPQCSILHSCGKYIGNLLGFTENLDLE